MTVNEYSIKLNVFRSIEGHPMARQELTIKGRFLVEASTSMRLTSNSRHSSTSLMQIGVQKEKLHVKTKIIISPTYKNQLTFQTTT